MLATVLFTFLPSIYAFGANNNDVIHIKGGTVVNAEGAHAADVVVRGETLWYVGPTPRPADIRGARVIDARGKYVMPGGLDPHTHLELPFLGHQACDDFFSGQAAALAGGTTSHLDFVQPVHGSLMEGFRAYQAKAAKACMDYGFHVAVPGWSPGIAAEMAALTELGVNSFKFYMAYKEAGVMVDDQQLLQGLEHCRRLGALAMVHAENGEAVAFGQARAFAAGVTGPPGHQLSRPPLLEAEATHRAIALAAFVGTPLYVVHVMSRDAVDEIRRAQGTGHKVIGEAIAAGMILSEELIWGSDFDIAAAHVMSPPLRPPDHPAAIRAALSGGILSVLGTDHAAFNSSQKSAGRHDFRLIPNGLIGIEERLHLAWHSLVNGGLLTPPEFVALTSTHAARLFNLYPRKGVLAEGADADVIILDPELPHVLGAKRHHSRLDLSIYEGLRVQGKVTTTISRGRVVWHAGRLDVSPGTGRFLPTPPFSPLLYGREA